MTYCEVMKICAIWSLEVPQYDQSDDRTHESTAEKVIVYCRKKRFKRCVIYLENTRSDMITALENR